MRMLLNLSLRISFGLGFLAAAVNLSAIEIVAHRGESADAPENTLAAFKLAWERGVRAVELDVHLTKDDRLVVIHDADTKRTAGEKHVVKSTQMEDLRKFDVGKWKDARWTGEKLVTLEEALALVPTGARYFIEVKVGPESVPALVKAVEQSGKAANQLCVISFNAETIAEAKKQLPQLQAYWIAEFKQDKLTKKWKPSINELISKAKSIGADGLDLSYKGPLDAAMVQKVKDAGLQLYIWTVDDAKVAKKFMELGVDGITTNKAAWLEGELAKSPAVK
jgi:glycerophosphoryl diester phosphodiesterase